MNKNVHSRERLSLYLFAVPITVISFFMKKDKNMAIFTAFLNVKFNFNSKYLFLYFIENIKHYRPYFVINDDTLREQLNMTIGNYFIETKTFHGKLFALKASIWFISSLEFPVGGFFLACGRNVIHLGHGTPLKNIGLLEKNISSLKRIYYGIIKTNISYTLASSIFFRPIISRFLGVSENRVLVAGHARNDRLFINAKLDLNKIVGKENMKHILYVPTWRTTAKVKFFPFIDFAEDELADFLVDNDINIFIRTHPGFEDEIDRKILDIPNVYVFSEKEYGEIMDYLNLFDLLITDYSSVYFDYLLLDRPIIFLPYDYDEYNAEIGFTVPYYDYTPGDKPSTLDEFMNAICTAFKADKFKDERARVNRLCNTYGRDNCKEFVSLLSEIGILSVK